MKILICAKKKHCIRLKFLHGLQRYVTILEQFASTQLALEDRLGTNWFLQDGARPHRTGKVFSFLHEYFGNRVIALDYPQFTYPGKGWPP